MREVQRSTDTKRNYGVTEIKSEGKGQISHWTYGFSIEFPINKYTFIFIFIFWKFLSMNYEALFRAAIETSFCPFFLKKSIIFLYF
jgi:hypothetical protein